MGTVSERAKGIFDALNRRTDFLKEENHKLRERLVTHGAFPEKVGTLSLPVYKWAEVKPVHNSRVFFLSVDEINNIPIVELVAVDWAWSPIPDENEEYNQIPEDEKFIEWKGEEDVPHHNLVYLINGDEVWDAEAEVAWAYEQDILHQIVKLY